MPINAAENERLGREALELFVQILLDHFATMDEDDALDVRAVIEDYLDAQPAGATSDALASRIRLIANAVT